MTGHHVVVRGLRLHYLEWGTPGAPPLLLLHGSSAHARWWDGFAPAVADRFHVMALDLRGHGDSEWARPPAYGVAEYAADVVAFAERQGLAALRLVGHSLGGLVAATAAGRMPERVAALALIDTRTRPSPVWLRSLRRLAQLPPPRYATREEGAARYRLLPDGGQVPGHVLAHVGGHALRQGEDGSWLLKCDRAALPAIEPGDLSAAVARLRCPILAVRGAASPVMPDQAIAALRAAAPQLEAVDIPGAHHHVMLERPEDFASVVAAFLDRGLVAAG